MTALLILGKPIAEEIKKRLAPDLEQLGSRTRVVVINNRDIPEAGLYLKTQRSVCKFAGVRFDVEEIGNGVTQSDLLQMIERIGKDKTVTGISVHLPLPSHIDSTAVLNSVLPTKDIEGTHDYNLGILALREHVPSPCAATAAIVCLKSVVSSLKGLEVTLLGRSRLLGKPLLFMLMHGQRESPSVSVCHTGTKDLASHTLRADVIVTAAGKPAIIKRDMVKDGAIVIDVGVSVLSDGTLSGDADQKNLMDKVSYITPVQGGVGAVTSAILLRNIVVCAKAIHGLK